ncbi:hypothetical protein [Streptomyces sp. 4F14]|uniref:hypothetical protein n=1 Tax=Streptomyces sp. 4F14 TaxID=3394380 RepID=UPI003A84E8B9
MRFDDLQLREGYSGMRIATQTARRNDLLAVSFSPRSTRTPAPGTSCTPPAWSPRASATA